MSQISIQARLFVLSFVLLFGVVSATTYLDVQLQKNSNILAEESRYLQEMAEANAAHRAFADLKYWWTELAVSLLMQSEREVRQAKAELDLRLRTLPENHALEVAKIRTQIANMEAVGLMAVEAYTENQRVVGNSLLAKMRGHATAADAEFFKLIGQLKAETEAAGKRGITSAQQAKNYSMGIVFGTIFLGVFLTLLVTRSINEPLTHLNNAIRSISEGDLKANIPLTGPAELNRLASAFNGMVQNLDTEISKRNAIEEELRSAKNDAEAANRVKSEFLAKMSHEIRTPMNGFLGMTSLLLKTNLNSKQMKFVLRIKQSGDSLLSLLNNLLDVSKIEAEQVDLEINSFDLPNFLQEVNGLMHSQAMGKNLAYDCEISSDTPKALRGDCGRIKQVLFNLISNAIKFTETGGIKVDVSHKDGAGGQCMLHRFNGHDVI